MSKTKQQNRKPEPQDEEPKRIIASIEDLGEVYHSLTKKQKIYCYLAGLAAAIIAAPIMYFVVEYLFIPGIIIIFGIIACLSFLL